jgi:hypothetical protein
MLVLINSAQTHSTAAHLGVIPQCAVKAADAGQKALGVRSTLLGKFFRRKLDDSTGAVQVIDQLSCVLICSISAVVCAAAVHYACQCAYVYMCIQGRHETVVHAQ